MAGASKALPWAGAPDAAAANFALGDLVNSLPRAMSVDGRIHAATLLAASGAIAGYAAQQALFARVAEAGPRSASGSLHLAKTKTGRQYYFGDALNGMLIPRSASPQEASEKFWPIAASGAMAAGLDRAGLPALEPMFAHVTGTLGGEREGTTSLENYRFQSPAKDLLKAVWPLALKCFNSELSGKVIKPPMIVSQRWRPAIAAITASKIIQDVAAAVPPADALTITMEAAIYASSLAPETIAAA
jgi:hypothetical protein